MNEAVDGLRILAADEDREALRRIADLLDGLGHRVTATAIDPVEAAEAVAREDPQLAVVAVHADDEHALDLIDEIGSFASGPIIALADDADFARRAAARGIYAAVGDSDPEALQSAIEVAMRRHAEHQALASEVDRLQNALERRALIERSKGILMERHGIGDREAFDRLRAHARSHNRTVLDVARAVTEGHRLLGAPEPGGTQPDGA
ncbi:MAG TPA: ANTAR domain-containing protein [Baekduia sp.]|nr:ANTAR domain-containing protein [Baekduia sp.]